MVKSISGLGIGSQVVTADNTDLYSLAVPDFIWKIVEGDSWMEEYIRQEFETPQHVVIVVAITSIANRLRHIPEKGCREMVHALLDNGKYPEELAHYPTWVKTLTESQREVLRDNFLIVVGLVRDNLRRLAGIPTEGSDWQLCARHLCHRRIEVELLSEALHLNRDLQEFMAASVSALDEDAKAYFADLPSHVVMEEDELLTRWHRYGNHASWWVAHIERRFEE